MLPSPASKEAARRAVAQLSWRPRATPSHETHGHHPPSLPPTHAHTHTRTHTRARVHTCTHDGEGGSQPHSAPTCPSQTAMAARAPAPAPRARARLRLRRAGNDSRGRVHVEPRRRRRGVHVCQRPVHRTDRRMRLLSHALLRSVSAHVGHRSAGHGLRGVSSFARRRPRVRLRLQFQLRRRGGGRRASGFRGRPPRVRRIRLFCVQHQQPPGPRQRLRPGRLVHGRHSRPQRRRSAPSTRRSPRRARARATCHLRVIEARRMPRQLQRRVPPGKWK